MFEEYARQIVIPDIGIKGQKKLLNSHILIIGCGGLGSFVAPILASAGIGKITLCDDDYVSISNLNRQIMYSYKDIDKKKVKKAKLFIKNIAPKVTVDIIEERISYNNFEMYFKNKDIIVDCTDGLAIKFFLNDACITSKKPIVYCGVTAYDGAVLTIPADGPCLRCLYETIPPKNEIPTCETTGILSTTCSVAGGIAANEVLKFLLKIDSLLIGNLLQFNLKKNTFSKLKFSSNPYCIACSDNSSIDPYSPDDYKFETCN